MKNIQQKTIYLAPLFFGLLICLSSCNDDTKQTVVTKFNLVMEDNFDVDGAPNPSNWTLESGIGPLGNGWGNNELQFYTSRPENAIVKDGYLIITAKKEDFGGKRYSSARLKSRNKIEKQYGRFEARMKLPLGKGLFPAFWMLGSNYCESPSFDSAGNVFCDSSNPSFEAGNVLWPKCGEIDIMEYLGNKPTEVFGTIHGPGFFGGQSLSKKYSLTNGRFDEEFHVFGVEWTENYINWYVDDVLYSQITRDDVEEKGGEWVFDNSFFMLLNLAVGGNLPGEPSITETRFPQTMMVDYVRIYQ
ncbi:MAG: glycoside hydrolase family 16 protein [Flavobacterium sp.]